MGFWPEGEQRAAVLFCAVFVGDASRLNIIEGCGIHETIQDM